MRTWKERAEQPHDRLGHPRGPLRLGAPGVRLGPMRSRCRKAAFWGPLGDTLH